MESRFGFIRRFPPADWSRAELVPYKIVNTRHNYGPLAAVDTYSTAHSVKALVEAFAKAKIDTSDFTLVMGLTDGGKWASGMNVKYYRDDDTGYLVPVMGDGSDVMYLP